MLPILCQPVLVVQEALPKNLTACFHSRASSRLCFQTTFVAIFAVTVVTLEWQSPVIWCLLGEDRVRNRTNAPFRGGGRCQKDRNLDVSNVDRCRKSRSHNIHSRDPVQYMSVVVASTTQRERYQNALATQWKWQPAAATHTRTRSLMYANEAEGNKARRKNAVACMRPYLHPRPPVQTF